jgi:hypothetical protein
MNTLKKIFSKNNLNAICKNAFTKGTVRFNFCNKNTNNEEFTNFGFKTVKKEDRQTMVNSVFANVAEKYDIMNDVMSLGIHRVWKNEFVNSIGLLKPNTIYKEGKAFEEKMTIIDVAGGTGDIAFRIWNRAQYFARQNLSNIFI